MRFVTRPMFVVTAVLFFLVLWLLWGPPWP